MDFVKSGGGLDFEISWAWKIKFWNNLDFWTISWTKICKFELLLTLWITFEFFFWFLFFSRFKYYFLSKIYATTGIRYVGMHTHSWTLYRTGQIWGVEIELVLKRSEKMESDYQIPHPRIKKFRMRNSTGVLRGRKDGEKSRHNNKSFKCCV